MMKKRLDSTLIEQEKLKVAGSIFLNRDRILNTNKYSFNNYS